MYHWLQSLLNSTCNMQWTRKTQGATPDCTLGVISYVFETFEGMIMLLVPEILLIYDTMYIVSISISIWKFLFEIFHFSCKSGFYEKSCKYFIFSCCTVYHLVLEQKCRYWTESFSDIL